MYVTQTKINGQLYSKYFILHEWLYNKYYGMPHILLKWFFTVVFSFRNCGKFYIQGMQYHFPLGTVMSLSKTIYSYCCHNQLWILSLDLGKSTSLFLLFPRNCLCEPDKKSIAATVYVYILLQGQPCNCNMNSRHDLSPLEFSTCTVASHSSSVNGKPIQHIIYNYNFVCV